MTNLVDRWKQTGLLEDTTDKETLAEILEKAKTHLESLKEAGENVEWLTSVALPFISRAYRKNGEEKIDVVALIEHIRSSKISNKEYRESLIEDLGHIHDIDAEAEIMSALVDGFIQFKK